MFRRIFNSYANSVFNQKAKTDYLQSRGTLHLEILKEAIQYYYQELPLISQYELSIMEGQKELSGQDIHNDSALIGEFDTALSSVIQIRDHTLMIIQKLEEHISSLEEMSYELFFECFETNENYDLVEEYIKGVYAEWESTPDWFSIYVLNKVSEKRLQYQSTALLHKIKDIVIPIQHLQIQLDIVIKPVSDEIFSVQIFRLIDDNKELITHIRSLWQYGFHTLSLGDGKLYTVSFDDFQTLLSIKCAMTEILSDSTILIRTDPSITGYLISRNNVKIPSKRTYIKVEYESEQPLSSLPDIQIDNSNPPFSPEESDLFSESERGKELKPVNIGVFIDGTAQDGLNFTIIYEDDSTETTQAVRD